MNKITMTIPVALVAICTGFSTAAQAQCGVPLNMKLPVVVPDSLGGHPAAPTAQAVKAHPEAQKPKEDNDAFSIVGLWNVNFVSGGVTADQGFDLWNSDGTEILNDTPPPSTGNVCLGVWTKTGPTTYQLKHPSWTFDASGNLNGTAIIRETVTLGPGADSFSGPYTVDVIDLNGKNQGHFEGTITGTRIKADS